MRNRLTGAERKLFTAVITGVLTDLRVGNTDADDPARGTSWGTRRQIRAELLVELLTGTRLLDGKSPRAIKLRGAAVIGRLDLDAATLVCPLLLQDCHIDEPVTLDEATAPAVRMPGCHLPALNATQLRTTGDLDLEGIAVAPNGQVRLTGAHIGGQLNLNGATLTNPGGTALSADNLTVDQDMSCSTGFSAQGAVSLRGAHIGGQLNLSGAELANPDGMALTAVSLTVGQSMNCDGLRATGEIHLNGAHIAGQLRLDSTIRVKTGGFALAAASLTVGASMRCDGLTATGEIHLHGAHIGGQLNLSDANLANPDKIALAAVRLIVERDMLCDGLRATGEIRMNGARIGGQLSLDSATLTNPGVALAAVGLNVAEDMRCSAEFTATGEINLNGASIGGDLNLAGASLANPTGAALNAEAASTKTLHLPQTRPDGDIDLTNARVGVFVDDEKSWPAVLHLRGFVYESLENRDVSTRARLRWLKLHPGRFTPELYDQLAASYRRVGEESAARTIAVAKQWRRRRTYSPLNWLWYATAGYGYRTWLAGIWLVALVGLGTWVFSGAYPAHMAAISSNPPPFHAPVYALDILLPVIGLGQKTAWQPQGSTYLYWSWALTIAGWVLTTAVVAGLTGILKRD